MKFLKSTITHQVHQQLEKEAQPTGKTRNVAKASLIDEPCKIVQHVPTCCVNMLRSFGQSLRNMLQQNPTMFHDVAWNVASVWPGLYCQYCIFLNVKANTHTSPPWINIMLTGFFWCLSMLSPRPTASEGTKRDAISIFLAWSRRTHHLHYACARVLLRFQLSAILVLAQSNFDQFLSTNLMRSNIET